MATKILNRNQDGGQTYTQSIYTGTGLISPLYSSLKIFPQPPSYTTKWTSDIDAQI